MARYSGPAMAAGAISQAIGDLFEGLIAGERGALGAEQKLSEMSVAERGQALKQASFPYEAAGSVAASQLAGAQTEKAQQESDRLRRMTPEEVLGTRAETQRTGAQTRVLGGQAQAMDLEHEQQLRAIEDWDKVKAAVQAQNRAPNRSDMRTWLMRHPVLLAGQNKIPVSALLDMAELENYLGMLKAQGADKLPEHMLNIDKQAQAEARQFLEASFGKEAGLTGGGDWFGSSMGVEASDLQNWTRAAARNRLILSTLGAQGQDQLTKPGPAPKRLVDYVMGQLRNDYPNMDKTESMALAHEILALVGMGATSWQAAFGNLRRAIGDKPGVSGGPKSNYDYDPSSGEFR